ncbi:MAG: hypothetical protein HC781_20865 [Leptolyngbyaceae cyanobacterium CSU_1_4]|nr:hypothetical protein [Leptolyngbyaceae cyanobacterium CSU_1_4]
MPLVGHDRTQHICTPILKAWLHCNAAIALHNSSSIAPLPQAFENGRPSYHHQRSPLLQNPDRSRHAPARTRQGQELPEEMRDHACKL